MKGCGHSRSAKFCSEECQTKAHDQEHYDPLEWTWGCQICSARSERIVAEMARDEEEAKIERAIDADMDFQKHPI